MKVSLKTAGTLGEYLPPGSGRNTAELELPEGSTPIDVMRKLGMPTEERYLVTLNGAVVPTAKRESCKLSDRDQLCIMPPLKGG